MDGNLTDSNLDYGDAAVRAFIVVHQSNHKGCIYVTHKGTSKLNKIFHIDLTIYYPSGLVETHDVKNNMKDINDTEHVVGEFKGVYGFDGSLRGKQHYITIQHNKQDESLFWIIPRKLLEAWADKYTSSEWVENPQDAVYKRYGRKHQGKDDEITYIPLDDVIHFTTQLILKEND